jgi:hypothetical protein
MNADVDDFLVETGAENLIEENVFSSKGYEKIALFRRASDVILAECAEKRRERRDDEYMI